MIRSYATPKSFAADKRPHISVPLIGALLVAEGLVTQEQLEDCLFFQAHDCPSTPIGQILLQHGYISDRDLSRALAIQNDFAASLQGKIEFHSPRSSDLTALVLHSDIDQWLSELLKRLGVSITQASHWTELRALWNQQEPHLIFVDARLLNATASLPEQSTTPIVVLPHTPFDDNAPQLPAWITALISQSVAQARERRRQLQALERLQQSESELSIVAAMSRSIAATRSPHEAISRLMITIRNLFNVEAGTLYRLDRAKHQLVFEVVFGPHDEALYQKRLSADQGIAGWVVRNGESLLIADVQRDPRFEQRFDNQTGFQTRSVLCVPIIVMGEVHGVLQLINKLGEEFDEHDLLLLGIVAALGGLANILATYPVEQQLGR
jgi:putative methionine-R-sulfoxide reductase with GAF domain